MTLLQALILGALQGFSELFPISSLAQTILLPALLKWDMSNRENPDFLAFVVLLHLATAIALLIYFWKDWRVVFLAWIGSAKRGQLVYDEQSKFAWLLVAGTVVVAAVGFAFEKKLRKLFEDPKYLWVVAAVLVLNGVMMILADLVKQRATKTHNSNSQRKKAYELTFIEGAAVGATQSLALVPGISRSGVTIVAGLLAGLSYEEAGRFSFMLATPIIGLAALLKVPTLLHLQARHMLNVGIPSAILSGLTAYFSTKFLMRYFQHNRLSPFGAFCIIWGLFALWMLH
jgi:undecaprenyl-diphosphatase